MKEVILKILNDIYIIGQNKNVENDYNIIDNIKQLLYSYNLTQAISNEPLTNDGEFKIYSLVTMIGFADWVTIKLEDKYYSINIRVVDPFEEFIVVNNTEKEMIQEFMGSYNSDKRACVLTINGDYEAINTKITVGKVLCESASDYVFKPTFEGEREYFLYDEVTRIEGISDDDPRLLYELFEFAKEFRPELTHVFLEYYALKDEEIHKEHLKQAESFILEHGAQEYNYTMLGVYNKLLREANC